MQGDDIGLQHRLRPRRVRLERPADEGCLGRRQRIDGGGARRNGFRKTLRFDPLRCDFRLGLKSYAGYSHDVGLDHDIVRPTDEEQMLDIIPAQQDELALTVEVVHVDNAEARLARAPAWPGKHRTPAGQLPQDEGEQREQNEDAGEGDRVGDRRRGFDTELGQQDALSRFGRRAASTLRPSIITTGMVKGNNRNRS
ncbi:MAG TPA: hypothetical protein VKA80_05365 [Beijerinckiaceae bacterium]|nr:hypothetical protein [Beijerinckiaceae bacterium]